MGNLSRALSVFLVFVLLVAPALGLASAQEDDRSKPRGDLLLPGQSQLLLEVRTGQVLYEVQPDLELPPASLAKIMALFEAFTLVEEGRLSLEDTVTVGINAWTQNVGGSAMFLEPRDTLTLDLLIQGITVASGNDAAVALAEHIAGTEESFVASMNQRARDLGMTSTRFVTASGLPREEDDGATTAGDMALMARHYLLSFPETLEYHGQKFLEWKEFTLRNYNGLLWQDRIPVNGLKTGFTSRAGYHIIATAQEEDMLLMAVVLGAGSIAEREGAAARLLEHGFSEYQMAREDWSRRLPAQARVWQGRADQVELALRERDIALVIPRGAPVESRVELEDPLRAPVGEGEKVGQLVLLVPSGSGEDLEEVSRHDIVAAEFVGRGSWWRVIVDGIRLFFSERMGRA